MDYSLTLMPPKDKLALPHIHLRDSPAIWVNSPPWVWKTRISGYCNLWYAMKGTGVMLINGRVHEIQPGRAFLLTPGTEILAKQDHEHPIANFTAHFTLKPEHEARATVLENPFLGLDVPAPHLMEERMKEIALRARFTDELSKREVEAAVFVLLAQLWRIHIQKSDPQTQRIEQLLGDIEAQPGRYTNMQELCAATGLSPAHLRRRFVAKVGVSPIDFVIERRLARARELLETSPLHINEIAASLGYQDPFYFSRQFKGHFGISPRAWRERKARTA